MISIAFYKTVACRVTALVMALIAGCVSLKLYSYYLSVEVYGTIVVAAQILSYLPYLDGGFRTTTNREILATGTREGKLGLIRFAQTFYSHLSLLLLPLILLVMAGYSLTPNVTRAGQPPIFFLAFGLNGAITLLGWTQIELLIGLGEQASFFLMNALNACVMLGTLWFCLHMGLGIWAFLLSILGGLCACYPVALWLIRKKEPAVQIFCFRTGPEFWNDLRRLWRNAWSCFRMQVFFLLFSTLDLLLVFLVCGSATDAAIYGVVSRMLILARTFLQATCEAAWPLLAQNNQTNQVLAAFLFRSNGWAIGSVFGALMLTLRPFLGLYMGAEWTPPELVVVFFAGRLLITGTSSPAYYLLIGAGNFKTIADYVQRELIAAIILGALLGIKFGMAGVALGFLISTLFGEFFQMFYAYAKSVRGSGGRLMWQAWWRSGTACAVSCGTGAALLPHARNAWQVFVVGAVAASTALALGLAIGAVRSRSTKTRGTLRSKVGGLIANI